MTEPDVARYTRLHEEGLFSAKELAWVFLADLVRGTKLPPGNLPAVERLPEEIRKSLFGLLTQIKNDSYRWHRVYLSMSNKASDPAEHAPQLQEVCDVLKIGRE